MDQYPSPVRAIDLVFDVDGNGFVDLLDVRGNDEVAAILIGSPQRWASPDRYALIDPYTDQPGRWAAVAVGLVKLLLLLLLLAMAGAACAAVAAVVLTAGLSAALAVPAAAQQAPAGAWDGSASRSVAGSGRRCWR